VSLVCGFVGCIVGLWLGWRLTTAQLEATTA